MKSSTYLITTQNGSLVELSADYLERDGDWVTLFVMFRAPQGGSPVKQNTAMFYKPVSVLRQ